LLLIIGNEPLIDHPSLTDKVNPVFILILLQCFTMQHLTCSL